MLLADPARRLTWSLGRAVMLLALSGALQPALAADDGLIGVWRGVGRQEPAGAHAEWTIVMTIAANGGTIDYPSLGCGGTLTQLSRNANSAQFRETITTGRNACIDGGTITVKLTSDGLTWSWAGSDRYTQYHADAKVTGQLHSSRVGDSQ
jgi:hypothetical protein